MTMSATSTSRRPTSSRKIGWSSRSNGPGKPSRSSSSSTSRIASRLPPAPDRSEPHRLADVCDHARGDRAGLVRSLLEDPLELALVGAELPVALTDRSQVLDHGLPHGCLEGAVARAVELALDL